MKTDNDLNIEGPLLCADAAMNDLDAGCRRSDGMGGISAASGSDIASCGLLQPPAELAEFVRNSSVRDAVQALQLAQGTVHRLRNGYWPSDARKILRAWEAYKGRTGATAKRWVLRCVYPGGVVRQGRHVYTAQQLGVRVGELVAVARSVDGGLIAQPLELPLERFALALAGSRP